METSAESGQINYTPTYLYAVDGQRNACLDVDGDGVSDLVDLDDDNDGVLDLTECPEAAPYKVYAYNYTSTQWAGNVPVSIAGSSTQNVLMDQRGTFTDLTYDGLGWKLLASNVYPAGRPVHAGELQPRQGIQLCLGCCS